MTDAERDGRAPSGCLLRPFAIHGPAGPSAPVAASQGRQCLGAVPSHSPFVLTDRDHGGPSHERDARAVMATGPQPVAFSSRRSHPQGCGRPWDRKRVAGPVANRQCGTYVALVAIPGTTDRVASSSRKEAPIASAAVTVAVRGVVSILTSEATKTVTANESITRQIENHLIDFGNWRSRALADNRISDDELADGLPILDSLIGKVSELTSTVVHVQNCFNGADGMFSVRAERGWKEAHRNRGNLVMFPVRDEQTSYSGD